MFGKQRRWPAAAFAGGLAAFVALAGCEGERSVASRSAAAFEEAQKKGETFEDAGHSHGGHAAMTPDSPGGGHEHEEADAGAGAANHANHGAATPGHDHGQREASSDHSAMEHGSQAQAHAGHAGMDQSHQGHAETSRTAGQDEHAGHAGHATPSAQAPPAGGQSSSGGHAGHSPAQGSMAPDTSVAASETVPPGQPAGTLKPDALDAPAATSVADAQRSAEIAEEMTGPSAAGGHEGHAGHGDHGGGTYVHVDAGRETAAQEESHDHHGHGMAEHGMTGEKGAAEAYVCPMHPEVISTTPGKCPKCGMDLVKRRKE